MRNHFRYRVCFVLVLVFCCALVAPVFARNPLPKPLPNLQLHHAGYVFASVPMPDGSLFIGGEFSSLDGVPRTSLAKFKPDGSLDPAWAPVFTAATSYLPVRTIVVDGSGNVYVGGHFSAINGVSRFSLARFLPDGSLDTTWSPSVMVGANAGTVETLVLDGVGNLLVGGNFATVDGHMITHLAKVSVSGGGAVDTSWNPAPNASVLDLAYDGAGSLFVAGGFTQIGGQSRNFLAKVNLATALADATWNPAPSTVSPDRVNAIELDGAGYLYVGGIFSMIGGQSLSNLARLSTSGSGTADSLWNPAPGGLYAQVTSLAIDATHAYVGGYFADIGGETLSNVARVSRSGAGAADPDWNPAPDFYVYSFSVQPASVVLGGTFYAAGGTRHLGFAIVDDAGVVDAATPDAEKPGAVYALDFTADGGAIVGGFFVKSADVDRRNLLRINPDGTLDMSWNVPSDQYVRAVAVADSGDIYLGGAFSNVGGVAQSYVAKLSSAGTVDATWNPVLDGSVRTLALDAANVYVGGSFTDVDGQLRYALARIATGSGNLDTAWNPNTGSGGFGIQYPVSALTLDGSGNLYSGGGASSGNSLLRILPTGMIDPIWDFTTDGPVNALALHGADHLYAGGEFTTIGSLPRGNIAKLSLSGAGAVDPGWNPGADALVLSIVAIPGDAVYAGGRFTHIGGVAQGFLARLSASGTGATDTSWNPAPDDSLWTLARDDNDTLYAGGQFNWVGSQPHGGLAAFASDVIFANGFE